MRMLTSLTRRAVMATGFAALAAPILGRNAQAAATDSDLGMSYLNALTLAKDAPYLPPSRLHPAYSHATYVNTALSGKGAQKMWVIARRGSTWQLAVHDEEYWEGKGEPAYSCPVSTGRKYPGDSRSGPTPLGVFNIDERGSRLRPGWGSAGMYNALYIDLHYSSGRVSGVAIHGTTKGQYGKLGKADSHGCVRMRQEIADKIWAIVHPADAPGAEPSLWGDVPRFFLSDARNDMSVRSGYVRDGSLLRAADGSVLMRPGHRMVFVFFRDDV